MKPARVSDANDASDTKSGRLQVGVRGAREAQPPGEGEEFARVPRPAAAGSEAGRARAAGGRGTDRTARGRRASAIRREPPSAAG